MDIIAARPHNLNIRPDDSAMTLTRLRGEGYTRVRFVYNPAESAKAKDSWKNRTNVKLVGGCPKCKSLDGTEYDIQFLLDKYGTDSPKYFLTHPNCFCQFVGIKESILPQSAPIVLPKDQAIGITPDAIPTVTDQDVYARLLSKYTHWASYPTPYDGVTNQVRNDVKAMMDTLQQEHKDIITSSGVIPETIVSHISMVCVNFIRSQNWVNPTAALNVILLNLSYVIGNEFKQYVDLLVSQNKRPAPPPVNINPPQHQDVHQNEIHQPQPAQSQAQPTPPTTPTAQPQNRVII